MAQENQLTEAEHAVYDRQLRVWGVEVQQRLNEGRLLIVSCAGLAAEVAKNIVLAGVGSVTLMDDTPCSKRPLANFLVFADSPEDMSVASASAATLQEMNPLVKVQSIPGKLEDNALEEVLGQYQVVLLVNPTLMQAATVDAYCSGTNGKIKLYCAWSRGTISWFWVNLGQHQFSSTDKSKMDEGKRKVSCVDMETAFSTPYEKLNVRRTHKFWFLLQALWDFEKEHKGCPTKADGAKLVYMIEQRAKKADVAMEKVFSSALLQQYLQGTAEFPAVNAVLGGLLANELIKAVGGKGEPFINFVFYCLEDGNASIETMLG